MNSARLLEHPLKFLYLLQVRGILCRGAIFLLLIGLIVPIVKFYERHIHSTLVVGFKDTLDSNINNGETVAELESFDIKANAGRYTTLKKLIGKILGDYDFTILKDQWFLGAGITLRSPQHHNLLPWDERW